ncbi:hypothetical protein MG293_002642 [Ovis ammon polii]|uniref:Uncharacterized protein n=1 Tax=Ovis ammon polii TaxID=230172 RepID=A0AAD4YG74_OVIAM|nr:hypothetical protein MG293_002642 [Ovis ammon polii]
MRTKRGRNKCVFLLPEKTNLYEFGTVHTQRYCKSEITVQTLPRSCVSFDPYGVCVFLRNLKAFGWSIHCSVQHTPHHPYLMLLRAFEFTTSSAVKIVPENRFEKFHMFFFCDLWNSISNEKGALSHLFCCFAFVY